jgi:hypothetical protein
MMFPLSHFALWIGLSWTVVWGDVTAGPLLPDPLTGTDGRQVETVETWEAHRRPELLELFREHVYGREAVGRPASLRVLRGGTRTALGGEAECEEVHVAYSSDTGEGGIGVTVYYPAKVKPKGCVILIVNRSRKIIDAAETNPAEFWPVREIVARGYATAAFHNRDVAPDRATDDFKSGVFGLFDPQGSARGGDAWGAIAAWSWGASRVIDALEDEPRLSGVPWVVAGHSRGGKAALWCGAQDRRVALTISNDSGCTGAALARTTRGETVKVINEKFPHWFARNYHAYGNQVGELPVDQHALIALMAPRLVYVASASEDDNADPQAEFRACVEAAPVFALYGKAGVGAADFPAVGEPRHSGSIGYHVRAGGHDLLKEDWLHSLDFADRHLQPLK